MRRGNLSQEGVAFKALPFHVGKPIQRHGAIEKGCNIIRVNAKTLGIDREGKQLAIANPRFNPL